MGLAIESSASALTYVGSRPYIRGADVFRCFEAFARAALGASDEPTRLRALKLHREIERDGVWRVDGELDGASATLDYVDGVKKAHTAAFFEIGERITRRVADIPPRVLALEPSGDFAGRAEFPASMSSSDWLDALIEANKTLHVRTLAARGLATDRIRFLYVEELPWFAAGVAPREHVTLRHLGARTVDGRLCTLNAVQRASGPALKLCYSC